MTLFSSRQQILKLCSPPLQDPDVLFVHYVNIQHGKKTWKEDPWEKKWEVLIVQISDRQSICPQKDLEACQQQTSFWVLS